MCFNVYFHVHEYVFCAYLYACVHGVLEGGLKSPLARSTENIPSAWPVYSG